MKGVLERIKNLAMLLDKNVHRLPTGKACPIEVIFHISVYTNIMSSVQCFSPEMSIVRHGD